MPEDSGQAGALTFSIADFRDVFERAYRSWRDGIAERSWDGIPWASLTGSDLCEELLARLEGELSH